MSKQAKIIDDLIAYIMKEKKIKDYNEFYSLFYGNKNSNESQDSLIDGNLFQNESTAELMTGNLEKTKTNHT